MKKLICLLVVIVCCLALGACAISIPGIQNNTTQTCTVHIDANPADCICDRCGAEVECTKHIDKEEKDLVCDRCGEAVKCNHVDYDLDGICDYDYCKFQVCAHRYSDDYTKTKTKHYKKVICGCSISNAEEADHADSNNDGACDVCDYTMCAHTYDTEWSYDATSHWHENTCECEIASKDKANHADNDKDKNGICDVCEQSYCTHTYDANWSFDSDEHWKNATCGCTVELRAAHEDCDTNNDGICDDCEYQFCDHSFDESWSSNADGHYKNANCGHNVTAENSAHVDEDENGECDECDYVVCTGDHTINYDVWNTDETTHSRPSNCGHSTPNCTMEAAGHTWDADYKCILCEYQHVHAYATVYSYDNDNHWYDTNCNSLIHGVLAGEKIPHADADADNDGICNECGFQYCNHEFSTEWTTDGNNHWHKRVCDHVLPEGEEATKDFGAHVDDPANLETYDGLCDVCGYVMCAHEYAKDASFDGTHHWYEIICEHKNLPITKEAHVDEVGNDGLCEVCEKQFCNHDVADVLSKDKDGHWYAPICTHDVTIVKTPHTVENDDKNDGICDDCGYQFCDHWYKTVHSSDPNYHWYDSDCGHDVVSGKEEHLDEDGDGVCETCLKEFCNHAPAETYTYDGKYHWKVAACGHDVPVYEKALHYDDDENGFCDACERSMTCEHTFDKDNLFNDETHHWYAPTCGHDIEDIPEHKTLHTDTDDNLACDFCGGYYEDPNNAGGSIDKDDAIETPPHIISPSN